MWVKRMSGPEATDEQILDYYRRELAGLGGERAAVWTGAVTLAFSGERVVTHRYSFEVILSAERKGKLMPGAPLNCLMTDPASGRHYSELAHRERPDIAELRAFIERYLDEL